MWTYEEAVASGYDAGYIQNLETRVGTLVAACEGDMCPLMPQQCVGDECMPLWEYVRQLEEVDQMFSTNAAAQFAASQYGQQGGYPPQQGGYPDQQGGYPAPQGGYPPHGGYPQQDGYY